ncbi:MAG: hypothetical protein CM1200mP2_15670 [Planctomycetaceae bacterium]|nr:MAG: hypothetical protein CM1200mP2_15670 [Planctomycetaceae bacterium]
MSCDNSREGWAVPAAGTVSDRHRKLEPGGAVPYIVNMPEKDRVLMLVGCDYPHRAFVLTSDDQAEHGRIRVRPVSEKMASHRSVWGRRWLISVRES